jgi:hypothetical protein
MDLTPVRVLYRNLIHAGIPILGTAGPPWAVTYDPSATPAQITQGNQMVSTFDGLGRTARVLDAIYTDVNALTAAQQNNVWNDISAAAPPSGRKYLMDAGLNVAAIFAMDWSIRTTSPGAARTLAMNYIISMYTQDNPMYLVTPSFDTTINVPGDVAPP